MAAADTVVLATRNGAKLRELARILGAEEPGGTQIRLAGLDEFPGAPTCRRPRPRSRRTRCSRRARSRATPACPQSPTTPGSAWTRSTGCPAYSSARWAGRHGDDLANLNLVLAQVADVPDTRLGAQFVCAAALVGPPGAREWVVTGQVDGRLIRTPRGSGGFGYDPIFVPDGFEQTTAEMTAEAKDAISHRGRAFRALTPFIAMMRNGA